MHAGQRVVEVAQTVVSQGESTFASQGHGATLRTWLSIGIAIAVTTLVASVGCSDSSTSNSSPVLFVSCPVGETATIETERWRAEVRQPEFALRVVRPSGETLIETSGALRFTTVTGQKSPFDEGWSPRGQRPEAGTVARIACDATSFWLIVTRAQIDLTNPDAVRWWQDTIYDRAARFGVDGWMNGFGEYVGATTVSSDGRLGWEVHNDSPRLWPRTAREFWEERRPDGDWVFFSRAGYTGIWRYSPVVWTGDQRTDWSKGDGLPTVIPAVQSLGISGVPVVATDIGGLLCLTTPPTDRELYYR